MKILFRYLVLVIFFCFSQKSNAQVTITQFTTTVQNQGCFIPMVVTFGIQGYINNYVLNDSVTVHIDFGDSNDTTFRSPTIQSFQYGYFYTFANHTYTTVNIFPVMTIVTGPNNFADTTSAAFMTTTTCNNVTGKLFLDFDGSCSLTAGDSVMANTPIYLKNNGHIVAQGGTNVLGDYMISAAPGFTYQLFAGDTSRSTLNAVIPLSCSSSQGMSITPAPSINQDLIVLDTSTVILINALDTNSQVLNNCVPYTTNFSVFGRVFNPSLQDSIALYFNFGDGQDTTFWVSVWFVGPYEGQFSGSVPHTFYAQGLYNALYAATRNDGTADTLVRYAEVNVADSCGSIQGYVYNDINGNCIYDSGDLPLSNELINLTLNNNTIVSTMTDISGHYSISASIGNYTLSINTVLLYTKAYVPVCPASGSSSITVSANTTFADFAVECVTGFNFIPYTTITGSITPTTTAIIYPLSQSWSCLPSSGIIHLILDPKVFFVSNSNANNTYSFHGDTISWPFYGLQTGDHFIGNAAYNGVSVQGVPSLLPTDTLCFNVLVTPLAGDINPSDNLYTFCELAYTPYDPNAKYVSPEGIGASGIIPADTALTYTVQFQNTGTFAARDIYILDTLDADLDLATLVVLGSSHPMDVQILPGNVLRFNFPLIWLPDSNSNEPASHGWVHYYIDQKQNLAPGTVIENTASIYFDFNAPVVTNTTINTLENPAAIEQFVSENGVAVFPNPASDEINLVFEKSFMGTIMLTDALGRVVQLQRINTNTTAKLMLENLPAGVYSLVIQDGEKQVVKKIVVAR